MLKQWHLAKCRSPAGNDDVAYQGYFTATSQGIPIHSRNEWLAYQLQPLPAFQQPAAVSLQPRQQFIEAVKDTASTLADVMLKTADISVSNV